MTSSATRIYHGFGYMTQNRALGTGKTNMQVVHLLGSAKRMFLMITPEPGQSSGLGWADSPSDWETRYS